MKKIISAAVVAMSICLFYSGAALAQSKDDGRGPGSEMKGDRGRHEEAATLTEAQKESIKSILSKYSPSSLTAADAKAIHREFKEAGIRPGPAERQAIQSAGFDPEKLRDLDPPPDMKERSEEGREDSSHGRKGSGPGKKQD
jgi:Spy/CpxP family protein refolding chaperone